MPELPEIKVADGMINSRSKAKYAVVFEAAYRLNGNQHIRLEYESDGDAKSAYSGIYQHGKRHGHLDHIAIRIRGNAVLIGRQ